MHDPVLHPRTRLAALAQRLDVRLRLALALALIVILLFATHYTFPLALLTACLLLALAAGTPPLRLLARLAAPLALVLVLMVLQAFLTAGPALFSFHLGPWHLVASRPGVLAGTRLAAGVLAATSVLLLLHTFTPVHDLLAALRWARVSPTWVQVAALMYRYIFALTEQVHTIRAAQRVRLGYATFGRTLQSVGALSGLVLLAASDQSQRTFDAMVVRGYQGHFPAAPLPALRRCDLLLLLLALTLLLSAFLAAERWLP